MNEVTLRISFGQPLGSQLHDCERQLIVHALAACDGSVRAASKRLGIHRGHLYRRIHALGIAHSARRAKQDVPADPITESWFALEQQLRERAASAAPGSGETFLVEPSK